MNNSEILNALYESDKELMYLPASLKSYTINNHENQVKLILRYYIYK